MFIWGELFRAEGVLKRETTRISLHKHSRPSMLKWPPERSANFSTSLKLITEAKTQSGAV